MRPDGTGAHGVGPTLAGRPTHWVSAPVWSPRSRLLAWAPGLPTCCPYYLIDAAGKSWHRLPARRAAEAAVAEPRAAGARRPRMVAGPVAGPRRPHGPARQQAARRRRRPWTQRAAHERRAGGSRDALDDLLRRLVRRRVDDRLPREPRRGVGLRRLRDAGGRTRQPTPITWGASTGTSRSPRSPRRTARSSRTAATEACGSCARTGRRPSGSQASRRAGPGRRCVRTQSGNRRSPRSGFLRAACTSPVRRTRPGAHSESIRLLASRVPGRLDGISRDGATASFSAYGRGAGDFRGSAGVVDIRSGLVRVVVRGVEVDAAEDRPLSSDGLRLLVRRRDGIWSIDVRTGARTRVVGPGRVGRYGWLDDGRVAFLDARRRLLFVRPGARPRYAGFTAPRGPGLATWSPDGQHVLYTRGCRLWLLDRSTGTRGPLHRPHAYDAAPGAWSPDSRHFVAPIGDWYRSCTRFEGSPNGGAEVWDVSGREIGSAMGAYRWSSDGTLLLSEGGTTGSEGHVPAGAQRLLRADAEDGGTARLRRCRGRRSPGRAAGSSTRATPPPHARSQNEGPLAPERLYLARLAPRWRR